MIRYYNELSQVENLINSCNCTACLCIPLGNILSRETKCICTVHNFTVDYISNIISFNDTIINTTQKISYSSISIHPVHYAIGTIVKIATVFVFILGFLSIAIGCKIKTPKWISNSIVKVTNKITNKCRRYFGENDQSTDACGSSTQTIESIVDVDNEIVLSDFHRKKKVYCYHIN